jgi:hypothetical protein
VLTAALKEAVFDHALAKQKKKYRQDNDKYASGNFYPGDLCS